MSVPGEFITEVLVLEGSRVVWLALVSMWCWKGVCAEGESTGSETTLCWSSVERGSEAPNTEGGVTMSFAEAERSVRDVGDW